MTSRVVISLKEVNVGASKVSVGGTCICSCLGARKGVTRGGTHQPLLVEDGALTTEEGEVSSHILIVVDVRKTHMEDSTVVALVGVVTVRQVGTIEASHHTTQHQGGVGRQMEDIGCGIPPSPRHTPSHTHQP